MSKSFIKIEDNIVTQKQPNKEDGFVEVDSSIVCGMIHDGSKSYAKSKFSIPMPIFDFESEISNIREKKEIGGIEVNGISIQTDLDLRTNLLGASQLGVSINWKTSQGFVELTSEQITALAMAVGQHVQKCFNAEKTVYEAHAIEPYTDVEATQKAFDDAYGDI